MAIFGLAKGVGAALKAIGVISTPAPPPAPLPTVTRDDAAARSAANDELLRRKGGSADILNGTGGAEAPLSGGKLTLGR